MKLLVKWQIISLKKREREKTLLKLTIGRGPQYGRSRSLVVRSSRNVRFSLWQRTQEKKSFTNHLHNFCDRSSHPECCCLCCGYTVERWDSTHIRYRCFAVAWNACDGVRRDAACWLKPSFFLLGPQNRQEGVGCVYRRWTPTTPPPTSMFSVPFIRARRSLPLLCYPYWREFRSTWCAIVARSTLITRRNVLSVLLFSFSRGFYFP